MESIIRVKVTTFKSALNSEESNKVTKKWRWWSKLHKFHMYNRSFQGKCWMNEALSGALFAEYTKGNLKKKGNNAHCFPNNSYLFHFSFLFSLSKMVYSQQWLLKIGPKFSEQFFLFVNIFIGTYTQTSIADTFF